MSVVAKSADSTTAGAREYLTFRLDQEEYGIDILKVQEIRGYEPPTRIANAPNFIKGVVNLRGTIVPIVDMRLKFNCAQADYNSFTVVIILNLRSRVVGVVVDSVSDVMELNPDSIRSAPDIESAIDNSCILGLGSVGERMLILLDIEKLMSGLDMGLASTSE
ncbi:MAG: chemotaxis protein CheW [Acidovorax sp.]|jgi:purine-binding chemotaxis protein CheW|uniref:chemotaxis protein CheW n=1 Tax=Acidovorax sp. TaxID=1872122 RepID=UPI000AD8C8AB|nr:chemotaxis protein CheW [Acidovorax sp.]MCO4094021.1 chemotaxis protein CheW [Acidovorax sp.]MDH4427419.1 chemotaxis protein CheW [Acidovorax sp.]MDH4447004.1 chemotaxis protein CheW [Acidovorax sp.]MDH4462638.1 chemotaxis protein CheW [Acidovorax sp.]